MPQHHAEDLRKVSRPFLPDTVPESRIPPELVPIILGHMGAEGVTKNLRAFSHVCRDWYFFTRPLLFQSISFTVQRSPPTLHETSRSPTTPCGPLTALLRFLEHSPTVSRHIRTLRLAAPAELHHSPTQHPDVDPALLVMILLQLPQLGFLKLSDVLFYPEHYRAWRSHRVSFAAHLKRLHVTFPSRAADIASYGDALRVLEPFTGVVDELRIGTLYTRPERVHDASLRLRVRGVAIDDVTDIAPLIRAVKTSPAIREGFLRAICLSWVDLRDLRAAHTLLECIKSDLEHFGCQMFPLLENESAGEELFRILDFSDFPSLRALTLGVALRADYVRNVNVLREVRRIGASLPLCSGDKSMDITLQIRLERLAPDKHFASLDWAALDETLLPRCTSLRLRPSGKRFGLSASESDGPRFADATRACLVEMLPQLARAGKLIV